MISNNSHLKVEGPIGEIIHFIINCLLFMSYI